jgi:protein-disulfide isomerase
VACGSAKTVESPEPVVVDTEGPSSEPVLTESEATIVDEEPDPYNPVLVERDDAIWGPEQALVTVVWFTDLQDPFCQRVLPTLVSLLETYRSDIRIVVKHNPLPFHELAKHAALAAEGVRDQAGNDAFVRYLHVVYEHLRQLTAPVDLVMWAKELGVDVRSAFDNPTYNERVEADMALAKELGARGVPVFRINGLALRAQVYAEIMKGAKKPPGPGLKPVPPVKPFQPKLGSPAAP